jgi:hypothetical protein
MRPSPRSTLAAAVAVLALCAPAVASAQTYCVHAAAATCPGGTDELNDLQKALHDAALNPTDTTNTITVGPGTYTPMSGGFVYPASTNVVIVTGAGATATTLTGLASSPEVLALSAPAGASSISGLTIKAVGTTSNGLSLDNTAASHVTVTLPASSTAIGVALQDSSLQDSTVTAATPLVSPSIGIQTDGTSQVDRVTTTAQSGVDVRSGTFTGSELHIATTGTGLVADTSSTATIDVALLTLLANPSPTAIALTSKAGATLTATSLTLVGAGQSTVGVDVDGTGSTASSATVSDSIFSGFASDVSRTIGGTGTGTAALSLDHDIVNTSSDPGATVPPTPTFDASDLTGDPKFVNGAKGDYRPSYNSPAVDSGGSCSTPCFPDLNGNIRPIDGNGDGVAVLDRGAFEYARGAPTVTAVAGETVRFIGATSSFSASGTDPDADPLIYTWTFDDGGTATGPVVSHVFATLGTHRATVTATDPTGLRATASATTSITAVPIPPVPPGLAPPDTTPPTLARLALSHPSFSVSSAPTAVAAKAKPKHKAKPKPKKKKAPKGTSISFTLSETATVTLKIQLETAGVKSGGSCVVKGKKHPHGTPCTVFTTKGTLTRARLAAGADKVAFSGRIASKPLAKGSYRLTATAIDAAGNRTTTAKHVEFKIV